jgi:hypothetical protein
LLLQTLLELFVGAVFLDDDSQADDMIRAIFNDIGGDHLIAELDRRYGDAAKQAVKDEVMEEETVMAEGEAMELDG